MARARPSQLVGAAAFLLLLAVPARVEAHPTLQVVGTSRFDARITRSGRAHPSTAVSGSLVDDVDHSIAGAEVVARFVAPDGTPLQAWPCDGVPTLASSGDGAARVLTGADGSFCARARVASPAAGPGETRVLLSWGGARLVAGTHAELTIDASRAAVTLVFDPEPRLIALGAGSFVWDAVASVERSDEPTQTPPATLDSGAGLLLRLVDERGQALGEATTDAHGSARFVVPEARLAPPGPGELRLFFDGDVRHAKATRALACERRVEVAIHAHPPTDSRDLASADAEAHADARADEGDDETTVDLDVTSAAGPVPAGSVEGLVDGAVAGAAPVVFGRARLTVRWPDAGGARTRLEARYVPDAPWYVAGPPAALTLDVRHAVPWRRVAVIAAGLVLLGWFLLSRSRLLTPLPRTIAASRGRGPHADAAHIALVTEHAVDEAGRRAWEGRVVDAHDGEVVADARVTLERASFAGVVELARAETDEAGRFELDATDAKAGDQIAAHGPLHARVARPAPASGGVLQIALVSRRRAIVRRLVEWARRRGSPFDAPPDPTPAHIRRVAADDARTARWARAVEEGAFGPLPVDAQRETEIDQLGHDRDKP